MSKHASFKFTTHENSVQTAVHLRADDTKERTSVLHPLLKHLDLDGPHLREEMEKPEVQRVSGITGCTRHGPRNHLGFCLFVWEVK